MFRSRRVNEDEEWEGVVDGKSRNMPDGSNLYHYLKVAFTDGKSRKIRVDGSLWNAVSEGDGIVKRAGSAPSKK
ncbi:hypothetical protein BKA00_006202 [Actinomadura coerulea]|uniref:DUF7489 domain-containing protein n=1 Tax=Actinomadura coerulea TaxID=46159 RepID=A0A7X0L255_9ACTN|nr:hypothetical protein [Actinomadura coerulea]MBB6399288.1 hypothetical protein [Actinomadura coerulea]GGQ27876.1 hypothetical protein GCM10010187_50610 [Actinomadura coerulea]